MYADNAFRICLAASTLLHLGIIWPRPFHSLPLKTGAPERRIEMTYFSNAAAPPRQFGALKNPERSNSPELAAIPDVKNGSGAISKEAPARNSDQRLLSKTSAPPEAGLRAEERNAAGKTEQAPDEKKSAAKNDAPSIARSGPEKTQDNAFVIGITGKKGAAYEKYYIEVREKIRAVIEKNKRGPLPESEIYVKFIVERSGALKNVFLYKNGPIDADGLTSLAVESIKEAAPFPSFADSIKEDELQFNLPVRVVLRD
jgi:hypothetical protein